MPTSRAASAPSVTGENGGLIATGAGPNLEKDITVIMRVGRNECFLQFQLNRSVIFVQGCEFFLSHLANLCVTVFGHFFSRVDVARHGLEASEQSNNRFQSGIFF